MGVLIIVVALLIASKNFILIGGFIVLTIIQVAIKIRMSKSGEQHYEDDDEQHYKYYKYLQFINFIAGIYIVVCIIIGAYGIYKLYIQ